MSGGRRLARRKPARLGAAEGAPTSLDTEGVTQRVAPEEGTNSTSREPAKVFHAIHRELAAGRSGWLGQVEATTVLYRHRKALSLECRGRVVAAEQRAEWAAVGGGVFRTREGKPASDAGERSSWRYLRKPKRAGAGAVHPWHAVRAEGKRTLFRRVAECADESRAVQLTCRGCSARTKVPIGCACNWFCPSCRKRTGAKFRVDFERKRLGVVNAARRAGLMSRYRRREAGGRFGERLLTLTLPAEGTPGLRVQRAKLCWERFWRLLADDLRPRLAELAAGIRVYRRDDGEPETPAGDSFDRKTGEVRALRWGQGRVKRGKAGARSREHAGLRGDELSLWDLVSYLWVREWTPGADGLGHPHLHVWLFSPYVAQSQLQAVWARAIADVMGRELGEVDGRATVRDAQHRTEFAPVVDVRAAYELEGKRQSVANELVKYLTKEWEISETGVRRAAPEVFAQVFAASDGGRQRQSSAGLSDWAVRKISICPCCGHEAERGHWARIAIVYRAAEDAADRLRKCPPRPPAPAIPNGAPARRDLERALRDAYARAVAVGWPELEHARVEACVEALRLHDASVARIELDAERDRAWLESTEARLVRARWKATMKG